MRIKVRVVPRAKKTCIESFEDGLKVHMSEPAIDGRANKKLIEILADYYRVKKYNITIVKGEKQKDKIVNIADSV